MSSPLTLAEARKMAAMARADWCPKCRLQSCSASCDVAHEIALVATIEWLVERLEPLMLHCGYPRSECDSCDAECENVRTWMRGKA
jgi:hypothetical protein